MEWETANIGLCLCIPGQGVDQKPDVWKPVRTKWPLILFMETH